MNTQVDEPTGFMTWALPVFSISILIASIIGLYLGAKSRKMEMREYLNVFFIEYFDMFIFVFLVASYLAEAIVATVLHPHNEAPVSPAARWITHNSMSLLGFICAIASAKLAASAIQALPYFFQKEELDATSNKMKITRKRAAQLPILLILGTIVTTFLAIYVPYWNTSIIAKGFNQTEEFNYAFDVLVHRFTSKAEIASWYRGKFDPTRANVEYLSYNMTASYYLMLCHISGSALKGIFAAMDMFIVGSDGYVEKYQKMLVRKNVNTSINDRANKGNPANPADDAAKKTGTTPPKPNPVPNSSDSIQTCLEILLDDSNKPIFDTPDKIKSMRDKILAKGSALTGNAYSNILSEFNTLKDGIIEVQRSTASAADKEDKLTTIRFSIETILSSPIKNGGLELQVTA